MGITGEQSIKIGLLSDNRLYRLAGEYVDRHHQIPDDSQLNSLREYSQDGEQLVKFVNHQELKDWQRSKAFYKDFYHDIAAFMRGLDKMVAEEKLIPGGLVKREYSRASREIKSALAYEYIQHLVTAGLLKNAINRGGK